MKPNVYFIHTPKTGGTSIKVYGNLTRKSRHPTKVPLLPWMGISIAKTHLTVNQNLDIFGPRFYHQYDKIAGFVRDPYTRFISSVSEFRRIFSDVPESQLGIPDMLARFSEGRFLAECRFALFHPQWRFFYHPSYWFTGTNDKTFRENGYRVADKIFRYEKYEESVEKLLKFFEVPAAKEALSRERSTSMDGSEKEHFYEEILKAKRGSPLWEARRKFYRLYAKDFHVFGYKPLSNPMCAVLDGGITERIEIAHDPFWQREINKDKKIREDFLSGANRILRISLDNEQKEPAHGWPNCVKLPNA